jgi:hypothetical protein
MCKTWGIRKIETTGWQPQPNPVERVHRWLNHAKNALRQKFGREWNSYVDVAVFSYNTSIHDTTGYAPFKLLYGRHPVLPDDLLFGISTESTFEVEDDYAIHCSRQQAALYKAMIKNETAMATRNRLCRETHQQDVAFKSGEQVLYWQPSAGKSSVNSKNDDHSSLSAAAVDDGQPLGNAKKKHTHPWTGPHTIMRGIDSNNFEFMHCKTDRPVISHLKRLVRFYPWSSDLPSTSPDFDAERHWKASGEIPAHSTVLVTVTEDIVNSVVPFRMGRLTSDNDGEDQSGPERVIVHWHGNTAQNVRGAYRPAWRRPDGIVYYRGTPNHLVDVAHRSSLLRSHVIIHSFPLLPTLHLPNGVMRTAQNSGRSIFDIFE